MSHLPTVASKSKVTVLISPRFGVKVSFQENVYDVLPFVKPKKQASKKQYSKQLVLSSINGSLLQELGTKG